MTPSKAILTGCGLIAGAVVVSAALLLSEPAPRPAPPTTPATAAKPAETGAPGRYQIVKVENGASWRLDTVTGEMTYCRVENDRMVCARSTQSAEVSKEAAKAQQAEEEQARRRSDERSDAIFDRFMALFDRVLKMIEREAAKAPQDPGNSSAPSETGRAL